MSFSDDVLKDPHLLAYLAHAEKDMLPKMKTSSLTVTLFADKIDAKLCLEVGAAILYDKPIIVMACGEEPVPANLKRVASFIVQGDMKDPATQAKLQAAIGDVLAKDQRAKP